MSEGIKQMCYNQFKRQSKDYRIFINKEYQNGWENGDKINFP